MLNVQCFMFNFEDGVAKISTEATKHRRLAQEGLNWGRLLAQHLFGQIIKQRPLPALKGLKRLDNIGILTLELGVERKRRVVQSSSPVVDPSYWGWNGHGGHRQAHLSIMFLGAFLQCGDNGGASTIRGIGVIR